MKSRSGFRAGQLWLGGVGFEGKGNRYVYQLSTAVPGLEAPRCSIEMHREMDIRFEISITNLFGISVMWLALLETGWVSCARDCSVGYAPLWLVAPSSLNTVLSQKIRPKQLIARKRLIAYMVFLHNSIISRSGGS